MDHHLYEGVLSNIISVTRGVGGGVQFVVKKCYITLDWLTWIIQYVQIV